MCAPGGGASRFLPRADRRHRLNKTHSPGATPATENAKTPGCHYHPEASTNSGQGLRRGGGAARRPNSPTSTKRRNVRLKRTVPLNLVLRRPGPPPAGGKWYFLCVTPPPPSPPPAQRDHCSPCIKGTFIWSKPNSPIINPFPPTAAAHDGNADICLYLKWNSGEIK